MEEAIDWKATEKENAGQTELANVIVTKTVKTLLPKPTPKKINKIMLDKSNKV